MLSRLHLPVILIFLSLPAFSDDWPQWRGPNRDGVWRETGIVEKFDAPELKLRWRVPISGGYSGPVVAAGRVYVTDRITEPSEQERVLCFDWKTGKALWTHAYECKYRGISYTTGPRATVTVSEGRVYSLGSMGHLFCLNADTGKVIWGRDLNGEYQIRMPVWGIAAAPLVEGDLVIVQIGGEGNACLVAFDKRTGKERWRSVPDQASYAAPIAINQCGKRVVVCLTGDRVVGLNLKTGELYWAVPFPPKASVDGIATPVYHPPWLFISAFFEGSLMLRLNSDKLLAEEVWRRKGQSEVPTASEALHSLIATPIVTDEHIYGIDSYGELRCLDARTGDRLWSKTDFIPSARWATAHIIRNGDNVWFFTEKGELVISKLSPTGYQEISRAKLIAPTKGQLNERGGVCWSHPAFAYRHVFARNDNELVCASLAISEAK